MVAEREQPERKKKERQEDVAAGHREHDYGNEKSNRDCANHSLATCLPAAPAASVSRGLASVLNPHPGSVGHFRLTSTSHGYLTSQVLC